MLGQNPYSTIVLDKTPDPQNAWIANPFICKQSRTTATEISYCKKFRVGNYSTYIILFLGAKRIFLYKVKKDKQQIEAEKHEKPRPWEEKVRFSSHVYSIISLFAMI